MKNLTLYSKSTLAWSLWSIGTRLCQTRGRCCGFTNKKVLRGGVAISTPNTFREPIFNTYRGGSKRRIHNFLKDICAKVNVNATARTWTQLAELSFRYATRISISNYIYGINHEKKKKHTALGILSKKPK